MQVRTRFAYDTTIAIALMFLGGIPETPPAPTLTLIPTPQPRRFGTPITHR